MACFVPFPTSKREMLRNSRPARSHLTHFNLRRLQSAYDRWERRRHSKKEPMNRPFGGKKFIDYGQPVLVGGFAGDIHGIQSESL
jgi:hypothetical protein